MSPPNPMKASGCRVCGSLTGKTFAANGYRWLRCRDCSTIQKDITHQEYLALNPSYDPGHFLDSKSRTQIEEYINVKGAKDVLQRIVTEHLSTSGTERRKFLDVGCGMGRYLLAAKEMGFDTLGFEPSANHARVAFEHFNLEVIGDYFTAAKVAGQRFDLIMLSHVIEHIYDPKPFLHDLLSVLKPGGVLAIVTPNSEGIIAASTGASWPMLKATDHVTMISRRAFEHFDLRSIARVEHHTSEYPFEFAASVLTSLKTQWLQRGQTVLAGQEASGDGVDAPSPLRRFGLKTQILRAALTVASLPAHLVAVAAKRQACLNTMIVRNS